jgi:hypothetical protein
VSSPGLRQGNSFSVARRAGVIVSVQAFAGDLVDVAGEVWGGEDALELGAHVVLAPGVVAAPRGLARARRPAGRVYRGPGRERLGAGRAGPPRFFIAPARGERPSGRPPLHHKHIPPNIKRNRIPAPDLSFESPNLPFLIGEIEGFLTTE